MILEDKWGPDSERPRLSCVEAGALCMCRVLSGGDAPVLGRKPWRERLQRKEESDHEGSYENSFSNYFLNPHVSQVMV